MRFAGLRKLLERSVVFAFTISFLLLSAGCGTHGNESSTSKYDAVYSNLVDTESQQILIAALKNTDVPQTSIDVLIDSVTQYNNAAGSVLPIQNGFDVFTEKSSSAYNADKLERKWEKTYRDLTGRRNCRITAYEVMGSLIDYDISFKVAEPQLLVELNDSSVFQSTADIDKFSVLFNGIETAEDISADLQAEQIIEYWKQAGVSFPENNKIKLISVWFNGPDLYTDKDPYFLHCGHAAVLIHTESDEVLLLEKLDYNFPYQLIRFPSEAKALQYIVEFYCGEINDEGILPVVFVNDKQLRLENDLFVY